MAVILNFWLTYKIKICKGSSNDPMIIYVQFEFNLISSFWEHFFLFFSEGLMLNFSCVDGHLGFLINTKEQSPYVIHTFLVYLVWSIFQKDQSTKISHCEKNVLSKNWGRCCKQMTDTYNNAITICVWLYKKNFSIS